MAQEDKEPIKQIGGIAVVYQARSRRQQRSIRVRLKPGQIYVSFPESVSIKTVNRFIRNCQAWIEANLIPATVYKAGQIVGLNQQIRFDPDASQITWDRQEGDLIIPPAATNDQIESGLKMVLKSQATDFLVPRAIAIGRRSGLGQPDQWRVRYLVSRWGSYVRGSKRSGDAITLNAALIYAPKDLIESVIIHELCHMKLPDAGHGPEFWRLFETYCPDCQGKRARLRRDYRVGLTKDSVCRPK